MSQKQAKNHPNFSKHCYVNFMRFEERSNMLVQGKMTKIADFLVETAICILKIPGIYEEAYVSMAD